MLNLIKKIVLFNALAVLLILTACTTTKPAIPEEGLTLPALYRQAITGDEANSVTASTAVSSKSDKKRQTNQSKPSHQQHQNGNSTRPQKISYVGYTRTANNEIKSLFKARKNPSIPIYIYPHLTQVGSEQMPVPGYTSSFFLYQRNQYIAALG